MLMENTYNKNVVKFCSEINDMTAMRKFRVANFDIINVFSHSRIILSSSMHLESDSP